MTTPDPSTLAAAWPRQHPDPLTPRDARRRTLRQPRPGDVVIAPRTGAPAVVVDVYDHGRRLDIWSTVHGSDTVERADAGAWSTLPGVPCASCCAPDPDGPRLARVAVYNYDRDGAWSTHHADDGVCRAALDAARSTVDAR